MNKIKYFLLVVLVLFVSLGFRCGGGSNDPMRGFDVESVVRYVDPRGGGFERPTQANNLNGFITANTSSNTVGTLMNFNIGISNGYVNIRDAKVPARWLVGAFIFDLTCARGVSNERDVGIGGKIKLACITNIPPMNASPDSIDGANPPQGIQITGGEGFSDEYGMPKVAIYNEFGQLKSVMSTTSASVSKGIDMQLPNLATYYSGRYLLVVNNINADGTWSVVGSAPINIYGNDPPDPPDPPTPCAIPTNCLY